jgi:hypothetical protein
MNRLKFMNAPVDEAVHAEAHTEIGAQCMADEAAFTWAYLMYDWGFPLSTNPYDQGIGFDPVYTPRRFWQGIAEAAACGTTMVVKGTEYVQEGTFTLLTAIEYAPQRIAIGQLHRWLAEHGELYRNRENAARVGLLHPGDALWQVWDRLAPLYFGAGQALLAAGIPWQVIAPEQAVPNLGCLLYFGQELAQDAVPPGVRVVSVADLRGWEPSSPSFLSRQPLARSLVASGVTWLFQAYMHRRWVRRLGDRLGLPQLIIQSPHFALPPAPAQHSLLAALGKLPYPRIAAPEPVLTEVWRQGALWQLHLVNYAPEMQRVVVDFGAAVVGRCLSPDRATTLGGTGASDRFRGSEITLALDVYAVLEYTGQAS